MSSTANITVDLGDREVLEGTATDAAGTPVALNGVGVVITCTVKKTSQTPDPALISLNSTDDPTQVVILDNGVSPNIGKYRIIFMPDDLALLDAGYFVYSVYADLGSGNGQSLVVGTLIVNGNAQHG